MRRLGIVCLMLLACGAGCAHTRRTAAREEGQQQEGDALQNPVLIRAQNDNDCWERTVDLLHDYFEIARENRLDGVIETRPKVGASLFEPWHKDSAGLKNRLESTLQSIRRKAFISVTATPEGGDIWWGSRCIRRSKTFRREGEIPRGARRFRRTALCNGICGRSWVNRRRMGGLGWGGTRDWSRRSWRICSGNSGSSRFFPVNSRVFGWFRLGMVGK